MQINRMKALLRDAVKRYRTQPFERFALLGDEQLFEEIGGEPDQGPEGNYCQIEVAVLDRFMEEGVDVLHVPITARDGYKELGVSLFFYRDGRVEWDGKISEFRGGIPHPLADD